MARFGAILQDKYPVPKGFDGLLQGDIEKWDKGVPARI